MMIAQTLVNARRMLACQSLPMRILDLTSGSLVQKPIGRRFIMLLLSVILPCVVEKPKSINYINNSHHLTCETCEVDG